jgi:hypothetical protein
MPAVEICSETSAAGMIDSARTHAVIRQEDNLQEAAHRRVAIDDLGDVVDQLDDQLGRLIAGRSLAGEDPDLRHPIAARLRAHCVVQRNRFEEVQQLALVLVDSLDLNIE